MWFFETTYYQYTSDWVQNHNFTFVYTAAFTKNHLKSKDSFWFDTNVFMVMIIKFLYCVATKKYFISSGRPLLSLRCRFHQRITFVKEINHTISPTFCLKHAYTPKFAQYVSLNLCAISESPQNALNFVSAKAHQKMLMKLTLGNPNSFVLFL